MNVLHYDTETTGLPVPGVPSNDPRQPRIVTISAILDDEDGNEMTRYSAIIRPDGWEIDERLTGDDGRPTAFSIHGITNARAQAEGVPLQDALTSFMSMAAVADVLSAFNHFFDFKLVKIGCANIGDLGEEIRKILETKSAICTMESAANFLIGKNRISLKNAYFECFKEETQTDAHHNSERDVEASRRIFHHLKKAGGLLPPKPLERPTYDTPLEAA